MINTSLLYLFEASGERVERENVLLMFGLNKTAAKINFKYLS